MQFKLPILLQYLAPHQALTWLAKVLCECRWQWWKNWQINFLIRRYGADLQAAQLTNIEDYPTFNSFFTRHLKPELRPIVQGSREIACPVDGAVSQIGKIHQNKLLQAKGFDYTLISLLGGSQTHTNTFANGSFATIYLAPKDYHRIHMPFSGTLHETIYIPGKLFSVNQMTTQYIPRLFSRNERLVCIFDTEIGKMAVILVGAMLVGNIQTVWSKEVPHSKNIRITEYTDTIKLNRGEELGHFKMGSTVIVLFEKDKTEWSSLLTASDTVKMGQLLATAL